MKTIPRFLLVVLVLFCGLSAYASDLPQLKVLTFNTWLLDIPIFPLGLRSNVSDDFSERLSELPQALADTQADIVVLEEVWSDWSKQQLVRAMRAKGYAYAAYTRASRWVFLFQTEMGDGLLVLSKYPISENILSYQFKEATQSVEKYASKGALRLQIKHPDLGWIDLYASHAGAVDFKDGNYEPEQVARHRSQIEELTQFIEKTRTHAVTILAADLNMHYQKWNGQAYENQYSDLYEHLKKGACRNQTPFIDTYLYSNHKTAAETPDYTFSKTNPYVDQGYFDALPNEVEDYIFVCANPDLRPLHSELVLNQAIEKDGKKHMLSDHFGVMTSFEFHPKPEPEITESLPIASIGLKYSPEAAH